ncbi:conserved hypothetical protein [Gammaproteobacteria bacterium]
MIPLPRLEPPLAIFTLTQEVAIHRIEAPMFILGDGLFPQQCGKARRVGFHQIQLFPYASAECHQSVISRRGRILDADLRVPWALVPPDDRRELQDLSTRGMARVRTAVIQGVRMPFFNEEYAQVLADILQGAIRQAWRAPSVREATSQVFGAVRQESLNKLAENLSPLLTAKAEQGLWRGLAGYTLNLFSREPRQYGQLAELAQEILRDTQVQARLVEALPAILGTEEAIRAVPVIAAELGRSLLEDPRFVPLMARILSDPRFLPLETSTPGERLLTVVPQRLMRLRQKRDHNPLVAHVLRNLIGGERSFLVLLLTPEQETLLMANDLPSGVALVRGGKP